MDNDINTTKQLIKPNDYNKCLHMGCLQCIYYQNSIHGRHMADILSTIRCFLSDISMLGGVELAWPKICFYWFDDSES